LYIVNRVSVDTAKKKWWDMMKEYRKKKLSLFLTSAIFMISFTAALITGAADKAIPDNKKVTGSIGVSHYSEGVSDRIIKTNARATVFGVPLKDVNVDVIPKMRLVPGGSLFGVKFFTKGVMIVGMSDIESDKGILNPAKRSGLNVGDCIIALNDTEVNTVEEVSDVFENSGGKSIKISYEREGKQSETTLSPLRSLSDGKYRSGLWVRDSTAGIGTVTYYNPDTGEFAGLGHGICDIDTGKLMPMLRGSIVDISVKDIIRGTDGLPGEIKGEFGMIKRGELSANSERGVFGVLNEAPQCAFSEPVDIALSGEVTEGTAYIYTSLGADEIKKYEIELTKIYHNDSETKNFIFTVKDGELLDKTGGIVQGMSGSPILQNGRIVGAVTHVLINDPTKGYGIFIENMLEAAENGAN